MAVHARKQAIADVLAGGGMPKHNLRLPCLKRSQKLVLAATMAREHVRKMCMTKKHISATMEGMPESNIPATMECMTKKHMSATMEGMPEGNIPATIMES